MSTFYSILFVLSALIILFLLWRLLSNRRSIPCPTWLSWMVEVDNPFAKVSRATSIIEDSGIREGMSVLDAGCGPGRVTIPVAKKVGLQGTVVALDIQPGMLDRVEKKVQRQHLNNIKLLESGLGEGQLSNNQFDRALLVTVLGEIPNREAALQEIFDSLKADGTLSVTEIIFDPHFQRRSTVLKLAQAVGFREKERFGNGIAYTIVLEKAHF